MKARESLLNVDDLEVVYKGRGGKTFQALRVTGHPSR